MAAHFEIANKRSSNPLAVVLRLFFFVLLCTLVAAGEAALVSYAYFAKDLPQIPPFSDIRFGTVNAVRATHGQVLAEVFEERRYLLSREKIPDVVVQAFVASEDERFFEHSGLDVLGIARAIIANLRAGRIVEGASTITQQLARSLLLGRERSLERKIREAILARRLEDIYTKDQILLLYLNLIYLGEGTYGVQAASRRYFGKDVSRLSLAEAALIAGLPQAPSRINPVADPEGTKARRDRVLRRMAEAGFITAEQEAKAKSEPIVLVPKRDDLGDKAPIPALEAISQARPYLRLEANPLLGDGGIEVETTIDLGLQRLAQAVVFRAALALSKRQGYRGPIAIVQPDQYEAFLARNTTWLKEHGLWPEIPYDFMVLGLVLEVAKDGARIAIAENLEGFLPLEGMRFAAPYTEFPSDSMGAYKEIPKVSLDGVVKDATTVLSPGYIVLVMRAKPKEKSSQELRFELAQIPGPQGAFIIAEPRSGALLAVVGGTDFDLSQVDRTLSLRQSGSAIKPLYYSKAYDLGIPPSTVISGAPFRAGSWTPMGEKATEDMTMFEALTKSENNISLRVYSMVLERIGVQGLNEWAESLGMGRPFLGFAAEGLGADVTARNLLNMMATFALGGIRPEIFLVKAIRDNQGRLLLDRRSPRDPLTPVLDAIAREVATATSRRAMTREVAFIISANLRRVAEAGTAARAKRLGRPVCGKTGTLPFDVWFAGWTHEIVGVMWLGQDKRERFLGRSRESSKVYAADTALPPWLDFVSLATSGRPVVDDLAKPPSGIVVANVDPKTGLLAREGGIPIPHLLGTEPTEYPPEPGQNIEERLADF